MSERPRDRAVGADETIDAYFASTPSWRGSGCALAQALRDLVVGELDVDAPRVDVDRDHVAVAQRGDRPAAAASGATWPIMKPWVAPEKRPSVMSATVLAEALADERAGDLQHLAHARPAARALVADHDHVARLDRAA